MNRTPKAKRSEGGASAPLTRPITLRPLPALPEAGPVPLSIEQIKAAERDFLKQQRTWNEELRGVDAVRAAKIELLLEREGIDPRATDRWRQLALRLAQLHEPGFRVRMAPDAGGRDAKWQPHHGLLLLAVASLRAKTRLSVSDACRRLVTREPWSSLLDEGGQDYTTLARQHSAALKAVHPATVERINALAKTLPPDWSSGRKSPKTPRT
jgi:hypothetical protein